MQPNGADIIDELYSLAASASCISDPAEFFRQSRSSVKRIVSSDYMLIFYNDHFRQSLVAPFVYNEMPEPVDENIIISYDDPIIKDLIIARQHVARISADVQILPRVQSELFTPIMLSEHVLGCLYLGRSERQEFSREEVRLAELISYLFTVPLERIHWEERTQQTHDLLNAFREKYLSILDAIPYPGVVVDFECDSIEEVNMAFLDWLGFERQELFKMPFSEICDTTVLRQRHKSLWPPVAFPLHLSDSSREQVITQAVMTILPDHGQDRRLILFINDWQPGWGQIRNDAETMIYTVSHDLKTPIQSLKGYATLLLEEFGDALPEGATVYLDRMFANLLQMEKLVTDLLELSQIDRLESKMELCESSELLKDALESLSGMMEKRPINLIIDSKLPQILCDQIQITQVFTNLIANALKFTEQQAMPSIEIGCEMHEQEYEFYVKDNGIGIRPEIMGKIFDLFYSNDQKSEHKGTGIGLAIVKKIMDRHHGRIWVESNPGEGSVFFFTLQRMPKPAPIEMGDPR